MDPPFGIDPAVLPYTRARATVKRQYAPRCATTAGSVLNRIV